jgi:signal transduction histidine kinase/DNA-binding NarL/FixJ family response regulator
MPSALTPPPTVSAAPALATQLAQWRERLMTRTQEVFAEAEAWLAENPAASGSADHRAVELLAGLAASRLSRNTRAVELLERVLPHLPEATDEASASDLARALRSLGSSKGELGDSASAFALYTRALEVARTRSLLFEEGACHNNFGNLLQATGGYEKAVEHYRHGLRIFRQMGHDGAVLILLSNLAALLRLLGDPSAALDYLNESEALSEKVGDDRGLGTALYNAHEIHLGQGRKEEAEAALERAIVAFRRAESTGERLLATGVLARLCFDRGDTERADNLIAELKAGLAKGPGDDERLHVGAVMEYARLLHRCGSAREAEEALAGILPLAEKLALRPEIVQILEARAEWAGERGDHALAADLLRQTLAAERDLHRQQSEEALRKQQVSMDVDRLREAAERERAHTLELEKINAALEASRDEAARQAEAARRASEAKGRFLSVMSHELRTPVNAIHGCARLLGEDLPDARRRACLDLVRSASESLVTLVNHQLDLAKIEAGHVRVAKTPFNLAGEIRAALLAVAPAAANKGLLLLPEIPAPLPRRLIGDGFRLRQVLINLLGNAVRFTEAGHIALTVSRDGTDLWSFRVRDTGKGMTRAQAHRIFEAFEQGDSGVEAIHGGTGLGLTISLQLAKLMGGDLGVSSSVGKGTTFTLSLPLTAEAPRPLPSRPAFPPVRLRLTSPVLQKWARGVLREAGVPLIGPRQNRPDALAIGQAGSTPAGADLLLDPFAFAEKSAPSAAPQARLLPLPALPEDLLDALRGEARAPHTETRLGDASFARNHPLRILLVEDDPASRAMLTAFLEHLGYAPACAPNGRAALDWLAAHPCDLIITDLHMPELDGEGLALALRQDPRHPIIRIVAASATRHLDEALAARFDAFLSKPILPEQLLALLRAAACGEWPTAPLLSTLSEAPANHSALVDSAHWERLRTLLPPERLRALMGTALTRIDDLLQSLQQSSATAKRGNCVEDLHRLAGIGAHYGLRALEEAASKLEHDARQADLPDTFLRDLQSLREIHARGVAEARALQLVHEPA